MKNAVTLGLVGGALLAFAVPANAVKPVDDHNVPFGNGFPSGKHFNLNLIAKKDHFTCPEPQYDPCTGQQVYGNVIFIPRGQGNDPITVLMESGRKGPKGAQGISVPPVTDWCTESFPDYGSNKGDCAVIRLPANDKGYAVYARITGKPADHGDPNLTITPDLVYVEDEAGNDLILLGLVDRQGIATFASDGVTITRTDIDTPASGKPGKGAQKATNVTALFQWTGEVCYVQPDSYIYCEDEYGNYICSPLDLCCVDQEGDSVYEHCELLTDVGVLAPDGTTLLCPLSDPDGYPYLPITADCRSYENEWVFNIADFVGYLWDIDSTGPYVIKVQFYPL
ncbi:MAG: hypothetical protein ACYTEQ_15070 [Planctomycetota bacterium]